MADDDGEERTHEPTGKRLQDFRERGEVPRSQEVLSTAGLLVAVFAFWSMAPDIALGIRKVFHLCYSRIPFSGEQDLPAFMELFGIVLVRGFFTVIPLLAAMWAALLVVGHLQQRGAFPKDPIKFDLNRFNVWENFKEKFGSSKPWVELLKSLLKIFLIGWFVFDAVRDNFGLIPALVGGHPLATLVGMRELAYLVLSRALPIAVIIAALDYLYQTYQNSEKMKMTRQEVKDENKNTEGDPHLKAARKKRAQEIAFARTIQNVKKADVVITNPDHYAVALRYRRDESTAPIVVAKGIDRLAQAIKAEAARHDIPQVENRPLARSLHARVKEGKMIPEDLYQAVATILAVLWSRRRVVRA